MDPNYYQTPTPATNLGFLNKLRARHFVMVAVFTVLLIGFFWARGHGRLAIDLPNNTQDATYTLLNKDGSSTKPQKLTEGKSITLKTDTYLVIVSAHNKSYAEFFTAKRFLGTTHIEAALKPEAARTFVGNNPSPCMYNLGEHFYSSECIAAASSIVEHLPATKDLPTYTNKVEIKGVKGDVTSIAQLSSGATVGLAYDGDASTYSIVEFNSDLSVKNTYAFNPIDSTLTYDLKPFLDGFVVYDSASGSAYYFEELGSQPRPLTIDKPKDKTLDKLYSLNVYPGQIVATYISSKNPLAQRPSDNDGESATPGPQDNPSELVILTKDKVLHLGRKATTLSSVLCATDKLCTFDGHTVQIMDIRNDSVSSDYFTIKNAQALVSARDQTRIITKTGVVLFDAALRSGHFEYTFGRYQFSDASFSPNNYVLSLINPSNNKVALAINPEQDMTDDIDKLALKLAGNTSISDVSVNRNFIYIVPNYGEQVFDNATNNYTYNPQTVIRVNVEINKLIQSSGINQTKYQIVSTGYNP